MYEEYYGLTANPFRLTPDRKFWYGSEGHRKAMSYLKYGLYQGEGFIVITGDVGTGKSTLVSQLFAELDGNDIVAAQIGNTQLDADDTIRLICSAFEIDSDTGDKGDLIAIFEEFLIAQNQMGRRVLLVVDEAQNMTAVPDLPCWTAAVPSDAWTPRSDPAPTARDCELQASIDDPRGD